MAKSRLRQSRHQPFFPVHPFHAGIQYRYCQFLVLGGRMLRRSTNVFRTVRNCHTWHGRLHIQPGSCVFVTVRLSPRLALPSFSKNRCPRPRSMWQQRSLKNSFDNKSGAPPGTTHTHSQSSIDSCNFNREYSQSPGFQCLIVAKTEGHGLRKLDPLCVQTSSSVEHPFPLLRSTLSNQETRASCINHSLASVT